MNTDNTHKTGLSGYRAFATIAVAVKDKMPRRARMYIEVQERAAHGVVSFNLDDFPANESDLADVYRLSEVDKKLLPANGRIIVAAYDLTSQDFLNDYEMTLQDKQVVAIDGQPWQAPPAPTPKTKPAMHKEAELLVHATVKSLLTSMRRSKTYSWNGERPPKVRISFHPSRRKSNGDAEAVSFALRHWMREGVLTFKEYASFTKDPDIGQISGPWQLIVKVIVAHEMAHWAQFSSDVAKPRNRRYKEPHGVGFQEIYRFLRVRIAPCSK